MRFANLRVAGQALANTLIHSGHGASTVVLGIVRGGVPAAVEVASALGLPLDLLMLRALFQNRKGEAIRAYRIGGNLVLEDELIGRPQDGSVEAIFLTEAQEAFAARELACRGNRNSIELRGESVLLVDNGIASGGTVCAAIRAVRKLCPARINLAVPLASEAGLSRARALADEVVCLASPEPFGHVGMWHDRFDVPNEAGIHELMLEYDYRARSA